MSLTHSVNDVQGALSNVLRGAGGALVLVMYDELKVSLWTLLAASNCWQGEYAMH